MSKSEVVKRKNPHAVALGKLGGRPRTPAKLAAARANGKLGGRPRKYPIARGDEGELIDAAQEGTTRGRK